MKEEKFPCTQKPPHRPDQKGVAEPQSALQQWEAQKAKYRESSQTALLSPQAAYNPQPRQEGWRREPREVASKTWPDGEVGTRGGSSCKDPRERQRTGGHEDVLRGLFDMAAEMDMPTTAKARRGAKGSGQNHQCSLSPRGCSYHQAVSRHRLLPATCQELKQMNSLQGSIKWGFFFWEIPQPSSDCNNIQVTINTGTLSTSHMWLPYPPLSPAQESRRALTSLRLSPPTMSR